MTSRNMHLIQIEDYVAAAGDLPTKLLGSFSLNALVISDHFGSAPCLLTFIKRAHFTLISSSISKRYLESRYWKQSSDLFEKLAYPLYS